MVKQPFCKSKILMSPKLVPRATRPSSTSASLDSIRGLRKSMKPSNHTKVALVGVRLLILHLNLFVLTRNQMQLGYVETPLWRGRGTPCCPYRRSPPSSCSLIPLAPGIHQKGKKSKLSVNCCNHTGSIGPISGSDLAAEAPIHHKIRANRCVEHLTPHHGRHAVTFHHRPQEEEAIAAGGREPFVVKLEGLEVGSGHRPLAVVTSEARGWLRVLNAISHTVQMSNYIINDLLLIIPNSYINCFVCIYIMCTSRKFPWCGEGRGHTQRHVGHSVISIRRDAHFMEGAATMQETSYNTHVTYHTSHITPNKSIHETSCAKVLYTPV